MPARIFGGSMAPGLPGDHFHCRCEDCQFTWDFDYATAPKQYAVCPNCGFDKNPVAQATVRAARQVEVVPRHNNAASNWQRWDVIAFDHPEKPGEFGVKRIVGLPQERCEIKGGDIFINGQMLRKNYAEQRRLAILVFDNQFQATSQSEYARWHRQTEPSGWKNQIAGLSFSANETQGQTPLDWLDYQHVRGYLGVGSPRDLDAIEDADSYNQTKVRTLNRVRDLSVDLQIEGFRQGLFSIQFNHLAKPVRIDFNVGNKVDGTAIAKEISIFAGEELLKTIPWPSDFGSRNSIYVSVFDQQILLAVNGQTLASLAMEFPLAEQPALPPLSFGGADTHFKLSRLQIYRDIFYLDKYGQNGSWLSVGEGFVVLGDNAPISVDSRQWESPRLLADSIIGKVTEFVD